MASKKDEDDTTEFEDSNEDNNNNNMLITNGKELPFSIDSLLKIRSNGQPSRSLSSPNSSAFKLFSASSEFEARSQASKYSPTGILGRYEGHPIEMMPMTSPTTSSPYLTSSSLYPWLLAQRQAVAAASFHSHFSGKKSVLKNMFLDLSQCIFKSTYIL